MKLDGLPLTVMLMLVVTLTFGLLTPKSNQHIYKPFVRKLGTLSSNLQSLSTQFKSGRCCVIAV